MIARDVRRRGAWVVLAALVACGHPAPPKAAPPPAPSHLVLTPLADLVAAGGLRWIAELEPRALLGDAAFIEALAGVVSEREMDELARARGGVDLRSADELVVAGYAGSVLFLVHQVLDPARLEAALTTRVADVEGRAIDRNADDPRDAVVRVWGTVGKEHDELVVFGREAAAFSVGSDDAPLRAAELFAEHKMKRAKPVWTNPPLDAMARILGQAPVRLAAAGPFREGWAAGAGGLLGAATGAGAALRTEGDAVRVNLVLTGPWGDRAADAGTRLAATYAALVTSPMGRLLGLDRPVTAPTVTASARSVNLEVRVGLRALVRGLGDATASELREIMKR